MTNQTLIDIYGTIVRNGIVVLATDVAVGGQRCSSGYRKKSCSDIGAVVAWRSVSAHQKYHINFEIRFKTTHVW